MRKDWNRGGVIDRKDKVGVKAAPNVTTVKPVARPKRRIRIILIHWNIMLFLFYSASSP
jgi:hypothetical protein